MYAREEHYKIVYRRTDGTYKTIYPNSQAKREECIAKIHGLGYRVTKNVKLYPFNTEKHQHDFQHVADMCFNKMYEMERGEIEWDRKVYDELSDTFEKANYCFGLELPIAWVEYDVYKDCKELATASIMHRDHACAMHGIPTDY